MSLKYGPVRPEYGLAARLLPLEASQQFHEAGNALVTATAGTGHLGVSLTADTTLYGWVMLGFSPGLAEVSGTYGARKFTTSATAGTKYMVKPLTPSDELFCKAAQAHAADYLGDFCDIIGVNDGTAQTVDTNTGSTDVLRIIDGVVGDSEVFCVANAAVLGL